MSHRDPPSTHIRRDKTTIVENQATSHVPSVAECAATEPGSHEIHRPTCVQTSIGDSTAFDPDKVDLSLVEPSLRPETLRRISVLEEFARSRGPNARRKACEALGITIHQLYILSRAWGARRRAEDVTMRATKRIRPSSISHVMTELISSVAGEMPDATVVAIAERVREKARGGGEAPPSYPTINKLVRQHLASKGRAELAAIPGDLHLDVVVVDLPVGAPDGSRVRPQLVMLVDGAAGALAGLLAKTGALADEDVATCLADALERAGAESADGGRPFPSVTLPAGIFDLEAVARRLGPAGFAVWTRKGRLAAPGKVATALLGTSVAGYKLRPRLVGRDEPRRAAGYPTLAAASPADAVNYLAAVIEERRPGGRRLLASLGNADRAQRVAALLVPEGTRATARDGWTASRPPSDCSGPLAAHETDRSSFRRVRP